MKDQPYKCTNGTPFCTGDCEKCMAHESSQNFMQAGRTIACGHCEPAKYAVYSGIKCDCQCHDHDILSNWEGRLPEIMGFVPHEESGVFITEYLSEDIVCVKRFIRSLLEAQSARHAEQLEAVAKSIEDPEISMKYCGDECVDFALRDAAAIVRAAKGV